MVVRPDIIHNTEKPKLLKYKYMQMIHLYGVNMHSFNDVTMVPAHLEWACVNNTSDWCGNMIIIVLGLGIG